MRITISHMGGTQLNCCTIEDANAAVSAGLAHHGEIGGQIILANQDYDYIQSVVDSAVDVLDSRDQVIACEVTL